MSVALRTIGACGFFVLHVGCGAGAAAPVAGDTASPGDVGPEVAAEVDAAPAEIDGGPSVPPAPAVAIEPAQPATDDDLSVVVAARAAGAEYRVEWRVDGVSTDHDNATLPASATEKGQTWEAHVVAVVAGVAGPPGIAQTTVVNTPPTCPESALAPEAAGVDAVVECACPERVDPDADPAADSCVFTVDGEPAGEPGACALALAGVAAKGQVVVCTLTPADGEALGSPVASAPLKVANSAPTGGTVSLAPQECRELDVLTCVAAAATDADGDTVTWLVQWFVDGVPVEGAEAETLDGAAYDKGQSVTCAAIPTDGADVGEAVVSGEVIVLNSPPSLAAAAATPAELGRLEVATCEALGWADPDPADTEAQVLFAWLGPAGSLEGSSAATLLPGAAGLEPGDTARCRATPTDGEDSGAPVESGPVLVVNYPPVIQAVTLGPAGATASSALTCDVEVVDADGDGLSISRVWVKNGSTLTSESGPTLAGTFAKGDSIACRATPHDAWDGGAEVASAPLVVANAAPVVAAAEVSPGGGAPCQVFECLASGALDADTADTVEVSARWEVDGQPAPGGVALEAQSLAPGAVLQCFVTASDGDTSSAEVGSAPVTLTNAPPTLEGAVVKPAEPLVGDVLSCAPIGTVDPDCGAAAPPTFEWSAGGQPIDGAIGATLDTAGLAAGADVVCRVTPWDAWAAGEPADSPAVVLLELPPSAPKVGLAAPNGADGEVTCVVEQPAEGPDGEQPTMSFLWQVGASSEGPGPASLPAAAFMHCDRVRCRAVAVFTGGVEVSSNVAEVQLPLGSDCEDGEVCTTHACHPAGGCVQEAVAAAPCDDKDPCTTPDACTPAGLCVGTPADCDDGNPCTQDGCLPEPGCYHVKDTGGSCDADGSVCTVDDACVAGVCTAGAPVVCDDGEPCTIDECDALAGCTATPAAAAPCDDGTPCTAGDTCAAGLCVGEPVADKAAECLLPGAAAQGYCASGQCQANAAPSAPDVSLEPSLPVTGQAVECLPSGSTDPDEWPSALSYLVTWTIDGDPVGGDLGAQLPGQHVAKGHTVTCAAQATDGQNTSPLAMVSATVANAPPALESVAVTGVGGAVPVSGAPLTCTYSLSDPDLGDELSASVAWTVGGLPAGEGGVLAASAVSDCDAVVCTVSASDGAKDATASSPVVVLPAGPDCGTAPCYANSCGPAGGCVATLVTGACDDADPCTTGDTCQSEQCVGAPLAPGACADSNPCTDDVCTPGVGCENPPNSALCDADGSLCTDGDTCAAGQCVAGPPLDCSDGIACTEDPCNPPTGCVIPQGPTDFPIIIGQKGSGPDVFLPGKDEEDIEIIQGPQGGIHVNVTFQLTMPPEVYWSPLNLLVEMEMRTPCCDGDVVASYFDPVHLAWKVEDGLYMTSSVPVVFYSNVAKPYVGLTGCVHVSVGLYPYGEQEPTQWSVGRHVFSLVDEE